VSTLIFGGSGQLGSALRVQLAATPASTDNANVIVPSSGEVSLQDVAALRDYIMSVKPSVIINAAAYTKVDDAETNADVAFAINGTAPGVMAAAAQSLGARFVHVSTDYVFDGHGVQPYATNAPTKPLNVYGASKLAGERAVAASNAAAAIVRTAWVHSGGGVNFVATAVRVLRSGKPMRVVDDQIGTPTRAANLAEAVRRLVALPDVSGLLHFTDAGVASWYDVACCVLDTLRAEDEAPDSATVSPVDSSAFPRPARRPQVSILETHTSRDRIGWTPPQWRVGVIASSQELLHA